MGGQVEETRVTMEPVCLGRDWDCSCAVLMWRQGAAL